MADIQSIQAKASQTLNSRQREIINGMIDKVNALYSPPHASLYFNDKSETLTMTQNTWAQVTNGTTDLFTGEGTGMTVADDSVTIVTPGDYVFLASLSFSGTTNADVYEFGLFKGANLASPKIERTTTSADIGNVSLPFYMDSLVAGDVLTLKIRNTANNFDATMVSCSWVIWLLHY